jgi:hypothetical protein
MAEHVEVSRQLRGCGELIQTDYIFEFVGSSESVSGNPHANLSGHGVSLV